MVALRIALLKTIRILPPTAIKLPDVDNYEDVFDHLKVKFYINFQSNSGYIQDSEEYDWDTWEAFIPSGFILTDSEGRI